jgi:FkbM family methyltransferase
VTDPGAEPSWIIMPSDLLAPSSLHRLLEDAVERRPIAPDAPVVVYGAGNTGRRVVAYLRARGIDPVGLLDGGSRAGTTVDGLEVHRPGSEPFAASRAQITAVVAVFNRDADVGEIDSLLRSLGYGRVVGVVELHDLLGPEWADDYWMAARDHSARHADDVLEGMHRLADPSSRRLYERIIAYRTRGDAADAPVPMGGPQYFPPDVPRRRTPLRYVDCGAYTGDAMTSAERDATLEVACAFEPDPDNFAALVRWSEERRARTETSLWPCAVWRRTEALRFEAGLGEASRLATGGGTVVQAVAIDDVLPAFHATDLKMDIEGAEPDALVGARRLIERCRPRLAICVYHRPEHLWSISASVAELELDYTFYLRAHAHGGFDVVLYAIPSEQCAA